MTVFDGRTVNEHQTQNNWPKNLLILWIVVAVVFALIGCKQEKPPRTKAAMEIEAEKEIMRVQQGDVTIIVIDSCEYIIYKETNGNNQGYGYMAHKGNCKNPIHRHNQIEPSADAP